MLILEKALQNILPKTVRSIRKIEKYRWCDNYLSYDLPRMAHFNFCLNKVKDVEGCIAEAGVRGGDSLALLHLLNKSMGISRGIVAFDSFQGFPKDAINGGVPMPGDPEMTFAESMSYVKSTFLKTGMSAEEWSTIEFVVGYFSDSIKTFSGQPIALLHIDVDLGKSYTEVLEGLYKYVSKGGIILFDEYDSIRDLQRWPDAKPAIDHFLKDKKVEPLRTGFIDKFGIIKRE